MARAKIIDAWNPPRGWRPPGSAGGLFRLPGDGPRPPRLSALGARSIIGRRVNEACARLGTYGMGGPGFVGLRLSSTRLSRGGGARRPMEWLVLTLWGAEDYLFLDDAPLPPYVFTSPWLLSIVGLRVDDVQHDRDWINLAIGPHVLEMPPGRLQKGKSALDAWALSRSPVLITS